MIVSTDNLRAIADDMDEAGVSLDGFVIVAQVGNQVRVLSSTDDMDVSVAALRFGANLLVGNG